MRLFWLGKQKRRFLVRRTKSSCFWHGGEKRVFGTADKIFVFLAQWIKASFFMVQWKKAPLVFRHVGQKCHFLWYGRQKPLYVFGTSDKSVVLRHGGQKPL